VRRIFKKFSRNNSHIQIFYSKIDNAESDSSDGRRVLANIKSILVRSDEQGFRLTSLALAALIDGRLGRISLSRAENTARNLIIQKITLRLSQQNLRRGFAKTTQTVSMLETALKALRQDREAAPFDIQKIENISRLKGLLSEDLSLLLQASSVTEKLLAGEIPLGGGPLTSIASEMVDKEFDDLKEKMNVGVLGCRDNLSISAKA
jgi:hypothetical protein